MACILLWNQDFNKNENYNKITKRIENKANKEKSKK